MPPEYVPVYPMGDPDPDPPWEPQHGTASGGPFGSGLPIGGLSGQILYKLSNLDYDAGWIDNASINIFTDTTDGLVPASAGGSANFLRADGVWTTPPIGSGDVVGPASAVTGRLASFNGTTGKLIQDSGKLITDFANAAHTHAESDITGLVSDLAAKQPLDSDLTAIAALAPADDTIIQRKASAWVASTPATVKSDLALTKSDVGLSNVDNTADTAKPVSTAQQTALDAKVTGPASAFNNRIATFNGTTGKIIKDSGSIVGDFATAVHTHAESDITNLVTDLAAKAPLASPVFTGDPTAPTPLTADNDTSIATTAYVKANLASYAPAISIATDRLMGRDTAGSGAFEEITVGGGLEFTGSLGIQRSALSGAITASAGSGTTAFAAAAISAVAALTPAADGLAYYTSGSAAALATLSAFGRSLIDDADAATALGTLGAAPLASPTFTGAPAAPTPTAGDSSTLLATTAFVATSFAPLASPALTGNPTAPTQTAGNNSTRLATTAFVAASFAPLASPALTGTPTAPTAAANTNTTQIATTAYADAIAALKANLASPTFTGTPAAPTPAANDNSTKIATTAYVDTADALKAPLASPTLTGTPAAPTAAAGTNTTQIATTAFVQTQSALKETIGTRAGINTQTGTTYTFVLSDAGKLVEGNNASAITFTVPPNSSVAYPVGSWIDVSQYGAGKITIAAGAGVTLRSAGSLLGTRAQYAGISLIKRGTDEWYVFGDLG